MAAHPLHALFTLVDTDVAADGTALQSELRCKYCGNKWKLSQYPPGKRQGKWKAIDLEKLRKHMEQQCSHNNDFFPTVYST